MYSEKIVFDGISHRTVRMNEAIHVFDTVKGVLEEKKRQTK